MIQAEFEVMERYLRELEALQNYAEVKAERDTLASQITQLKERSRQNAQARGKQKEHEVQQLNQKLQKAEAQLASLEELKAMLPGDNRLSLKEIEDQFLQRKAAEIEAKAKQHAKVIERDIRTRMPALIQKELTRVLNGSDWPTDIKKIFDSRVAHNVDEILHDKQKWPDSFKDYFVDELNASLAREFNIEFDNRVKAEAQHRIEVLKNGEWEKYAAAKSAQLASDLKTLAKELQGTWWFTCDRCGRRFGVQIGMSEIAQLVGQGTVDVICSACVDPGVFPFVFNTIPHKVTTLTLAGLLQLYLGAAPTK